MTKTPISQQDSAPAVAVRKVRPDEKETVAGTITPAPDSPETVAKESGGRGGLEPTRYGDWEVGGICSDF